MMIAILLPMVAMAQEEKEALTIPKTENTMRMAAELSKYGYANHDALSLVQAARLAKEVGLAPTEKEKTSEPSEDIADSGSKTGNISLDSQKLLADAASMSGDDPLILAIIEDVNSNTRGAVGGPSYSNSSVKAKGTDVYKEKFYAGEQAAVIVIGDGDTDLDLYIYDANGNLITSDTDYSDDCVCTWTPKWTGTFTIKIVNRGNVYNRYVLRTN